MKHLLLSILLALCGATALAQVTNTINITPGENSVSSSLPFDKIIILKWTAKEPVRLEYAGLELVQGDAADAYRKYAQTGDFYWQRDNKLQGKDDKGNALNVEVRDKRLNFNVSPPTADGKYDLNIFLEPLQPRKFYDIKLLRRPLDAEGELYFDLFNNIADPDNKDFLVALDKINVIKKPFIHDLNEEGALAKLQAFYDFYLKDLYADYKTKLANKDLKDQAPAIKTQIKNRVMYYKPIDAYTQTGIYLRLYEGFEKDDQSLIAAAAKELNKAQQGYLPAPTEASKAISDQSLEEVKKFYNDHLKTLYKNYQNATDTKGKEQAQNIIMSASIGSLPYAEDIFIFGQTLSATTTVLNFDTRTGYTITPDFGYVYYGFQPNFNGMAPYVGLQFELRYFDKNIPFNMIPNKTVWHRLSFTTGLTLISLKKEGKRDDFFSGKSLLAGIGIRLTSATRITLGGILFNKEDPNPLIDHKKTTVTPFAGISIDLKLKSLLNDFYSLSPTKKP